MFLSMSELPSPKQLSEDGQNQQMTLKTAWMEGRMFWGKGTGGVRIFRRGKSEAGAVPQCIQISWLSHRPSSLALVGKPVHPLSHEDALL